MHAVIEALWIAKNVMLVIASVAIMFYTAWYFLLSNWRKYPAGRRVLGFVASLVAVLFYSLWALFDGDSFWQEPSTDPAVLRVVFGLVVYALVAYSTVRLDVTLVAIWLRGEVKPPSTDNPFIPSERTAVRERRSRKNR